jgi:diadenosine tetraphosphate (Ap4A) HIT family hydrolase
MSEHCPFCQIDRARILSASALAVAIADAFPLNPGHCLVIPRRHVGSWFDTTDEERREMLARLDEARAGIQRSHDPAGFNIGINDGVAAGQTVSHLHVHRIPRYVGDAADARGGIRWILPERADYWSPRK